MAELIFNFFCFGDWVTFSIYIKLSLLLKLIKKKPRCEKIDQFSNKILNLSKQIQLVKYKKQHHSILCAYKYVKHAVYIHTSCNTKKNIKKIKINIATQ